MAIEIDSDSDGGNGGGPSTSTRPVASQPARKSALKEPRPAMMVTSEDDLLQDKTEKSGFLKDVEAGVGDAPIERDDDMDGSDDLNHFFSAPYLKGEKRHRQCRECL